VCALADGWSLHAARRAEHERRIDLEVECRCCLRGPLALWLLEELPGGRVGFHPKHPASDRTDILVLEPLGGFGQERVEAPVRPPDRDGPD